MVTYKGNCTGLQQINDILKILKDKSCHPRILYPPKLPFRYEKEIKAFQGTQNLRELLNARPALQEMLEGALLPETKGQTTQNFE